MIQITRKDDSFKVVGHAGYAEHGKDIVCSAISAIAQTAYLGAEQYAETQVRQAEGYFYVVMGNRSREAEAIVDTAFLGFKEIAKQYPDFVQITDKRKSLEELLNG